MKINTAVDLTAVLTALVFLAGLVVWGIRLEEQVTQLSARLDAYERMTKAVGEARLEAINQRMDDLESELQFFTRGEKK